MATILHFLSIGDGSSYELHNLPFSYKIDVTSQDYTLWEPFEFEFCGQVSFALLSCAGAIKDCRFQCLARRIHMMGAALTVLQMSTFICVDCPLTVLQK